MNKSTYLLPRYLIYVIIQPPSSIHLVRDYE